MVALRPDEWKPIWSSASSTVTLAWPASAAAADRPAIPPPRMRMSEFIRPSLAGRRESCGQPLVHDLAALGQPDAEDELVVVRKHRPLLLLVPEGAQEIVEVAREQRRGVGGEAAGEVGGADDRYPVADDALAGNRALDIAARLRREVDDHAARAHRRQLRVADQPRRRTPRNEGGGDDDVLLGDVPRDQLGLGLLIVLRHFGRVAAGALAFDPGDALDEDRLGPERLDLLLGRRADVGRADLGTEAPGGRDRLQSGDSDAHYEHLG